MPPSIHLQPIGLMTGSRDKTGVLVLVNGELAAVLVQLEDFVHGNERGRWFLEVMFSQPGLSETFASLDEAKAWLQGRLEAKAAIFSPCSGLVTESLPRLIKGR